MIILTWLFKKMSLIKGENGFKNEEAMITFLKTNSKFLDPIQIFTFCNHNKFGKTLNYIINNQITNNSDYLIIKNKFFDNNNQIIENSLISSLIHQILEVDKRFSFCFIPKMFLMNKTEAAKFSVKLYPFILPRNIKHFLLIDNENENEDQIVNENENENENENGNEIEIENGNENGNNSQNQKTAVKKTNTRNKKELKYNQEFWFEYLKQFFLLKPNFFCTNTRLVKKWLRSLLTNGSPKFEKLFDSNLKPMFGSSDIKWKYEKYIDQIIQNKNNKFNITVEEILELIEKYGYYRGRTWLLIKKNNYLKAIENSINIWDFESVFLIIQQYLDTNDETNWHFILNCYSKISNGGGGSCGDNVDNDEDNNGSDSVNSNNNNSLGQSRQNKKIVDYMLNNIGPFKTMEILENCQQFTLLLEPIVFSEIIENAEKLTKQKKILQSIIENTSESLWTLKPRDISPQIKNIMDLEMDLSYSNKNKSNTNSLSFNINNEKVNYNGNDNDNINVNDNIRNDEKDFERKNENENGNVREKEKKQKLLDNLLQGVSFPISQDFLSVRDHWGIVIQSNEESLCPVCNLPLVSNVSSDLLVFKSGKSYHKECIKNQMSVCDFNTKL